MLFIRSIFFLTVLVMPWSVSSQGITNLWMSGYYFGSGSPSPGFGGTNINFISGFADTTSLQRQMNFNDCNANICDKNGNLLFYSNGVYIANANNDTMMNGSGLNPSQYTSQHLVNGLRIRQGNLILPFPGDSVKYYLIHQTLFYDMLSSDYKSPEIYFSLIDMSLDGGLGAVVQKNVILLSDTLNPGAITACKHANGRDWWLVFHKSRGSRYYKYLLTPSGFQGPFPQNIGLSIPLQNDFIWQSCFSPNGEKFASVLQGDSIDVMNFDRCTGLFSNSTQININDSAVGRGVAFSPNSNLMYVSSMKYVYQFDVSINNIDSSKIVIGRYDGFADPGPPFYTGFYLSQLSYDGKIYINTSNGTQWLMIINEPDIPGIGCNFFQHGLMLPTYNSYTIPNFPNYSLGEITGSLCDSLAPSLIENGNLQTQKRILPVFPEVNLGDESKRTDSPSSGKKLPVSYKEFLERSRFPGDGKLIEIKEERQ